MAGMPSKAAMKLGLHDPPRSSGNFYTRTVSSVAGCWEDRRRRSVLMTGRIRPNGFEDKAPTPRHQPGAEEWTARGDLTGLGWATV